MKSFNQFLKENTSEDYRGEHQAPTEDEGAPLYDVTLNGIYPEDIYSSKGFQYYNTGHDSDRQAYSIIMSAKDKPKKKIKIYRAVPHVKSKEERLAIIDAAKKMWMKRENIHPAFKRYNIPKEKYYDWLYAQAEKIEKEKEGQHKEITDINPGDWVTTTLSYAKGHGESVFKGDYKVIAKTVKAEEIFTDGNSWLEWGYVPAPEEKKHQKKESKQ